MVTEGIKQLHANTRRKNWKITSPNELDAGLELLLIFQFHIVKLKEDKLLVLKLR